MPASVKKTIKRLARPVWRRLPTPVQEVVKGARARLQRRQVIIEQRLSVVENAWRQHLPALLNGISSLAAFGYELSETKADLAGLNETIRELSNRVESLRTNATERECGIAEPTANTVAPRIIKPHKVAEAQGKGIKLNLGCGHVPLDGYVNVDKRELPGVDIVADVGNLPFESESVAEIFSAHVLEYFPQERLRRLLPYWHSLLQPQGLLRAIVPDGAAMIAGVSDGSYPFAHFREVLFGMKENEGNFHFNLLTPDSLSKLLLNADLKKSRCRPREDATAISLSSKSMQCELDCSNLSHA